METPQVPYGFPFSPPSSTSSILVLTLDGPSICPISDKSLRPLGNRIKLSTCLLSMRPSGPSIQCLAALEFAPFGSWSSIRPRTLPLQIFLSAASRILEPSSLPAALLPGDLMLWFGKATCGKAPSIKVRFFERGSLPFRLVIPTTPRFLALPGIARSGEGMGDHVDQIIAHFVARDISGNDARSGQCAILADSLRNSIRKSDFRQPESGAKCHSRSNTGPYLGRVRICR